MWCVTHSYSCALERLVTPTKMEPCLRLIAKRTYWPPTAQDHDLLQFPPTHFSPEAGLRRDRIALRGIAHRSYEILACTTGPWDRLRFECLFLSLETSTSPPTIVTIYFNYIYDNIHFIIYNCIIYYNNIIDLIKNIFLFILL